LVFKMRLSGSVKLRCALPSGSVGGSVLFAAFRDALLLCLGSPSRLFLGGGFGFRLQLSPGFANLLKPLLLVGHPIGHLIATLAAVEPVLLRIGGLRGFEPAVNLGRQLRFALLHALVAHRLVLGGIRLDLAAVERNVPELHQPGPLNQLQYLHEQRRQRLQMPSAELRDRAEVGRVPRHHHHEVRPLHCRLGDPPRRVDPARVTMQKQRRHHPWIKRRLTEHACVAAGNRGKIKLFPDQRHNQPR
jgi:hypothetical protein